MTTTKSKIVLPAGRLYPNMPSGAETNIPIWGVTGPLSSGKTITGLSLAPGVHPAGHPFEGKPRTLNLDFEMSNPYSGTGCEHVDVPRELGIKHPKQYTSIDLFLWLCERLNNVQPGQYDVVMADTIIPAEHGLTAYIEQKPQDFGVTREQLGKMKGLFWGVMKKEWERRLLGIAAKCQTFFFTTHLRPVWSGSSPVKGQFEAEGKDVLKRIATLYLRLSREPDDKGKVRNEPSAIVEKERLSDTEIDGEGNMVITPLLPSRLPVATIGAIRSYICSPPDLAKPKAGERVPEPAVLTSDEKAELALQTATAQRDTEETRLSILSRQAELRTLAQQQPTPAKPAPDQAAQAVKTKAEDAEAEKAIRESCAALKEQEARGKELMADNDAIPNSTTMATKKQWGRVTELREELKMSLEVFRRIFLTELGVAKGSELTARQCDTLILAMEHEVGTRAKKRQAGQAGPPFSTN